MRRLPLISLSVLAVAAAAAPPAFARNVVLKDREGRTMRFDVRATGVDVEWYADLLRNAPHGDEISSIEIRIVEPRSIASACGSQAGGCYRDRGGSAVAIVPAGRSGNIAHTVVHEYGHHVDQNRDHGGLREPNGTPLWWKARGMASLVRSRSVSRSYRLGWDRSIGEIFAEDYAQVSLRTPTKIRWLTAPDENVRRALLRDLGADTSSTPIEEGSPAVQPVVIVRRGTLAAGQRRTLPFRLLGPERRVTFNARVGGSERQGARVRLELRCGSRTTTRRIAQGQTQATIDARHLGPASCEVALANTSSGAEAYVVRLRLSVGS